MEYVFEFIIELIFEGSIEVTKNSKFPKYIRYPLIVLLMLFFITVIGLILLTGVLSFKKNIILGFFFILLGIGMFVMSIIKFKKIYLTKRDSNSKQNIK